MSEISVVAKWSNGMVMVFDNKGEQIPDYQGVYEDVKDKILADVSDDVIFQEGNWNQGIIYNTSRENFEANEQEK